MDNEYNYMFYDNDSSNDNRPPEKTTGEKINELIHHYPVVCVCISIVVAFLLGFFIKAITTASLKDYKLIETRLNTVEQEHTQLQEQYTALQNEYNEYKTKMAPYEEIQTQEEAEEQARKEAEEKAAAEARAAEEAKGYETGITFDNLARTPNDYIGKKVKFEGKVIQVLEGSTETQIRLAINGDYDQIIFCRVPKAKTANTRILEDDYIHIMGVSNGLISYESTMGGTITIPDVSVDDWGQS